MTSRRSLARAGLLVTGAFFAARVLGWIRLLVISTTFGASADLDAFFAAFRIPDLIFQLVAAGALGTALIPVIAGLFASDENARAWRVTSTVANLMLAALAVLSVVVFVFAPWIIPAITPGFDPAQMDLTVTLSRIMLLSPILLALGSVANSVLNARHHFLAPAIAPIAYNLAIIAAALFLAPLIGVTGLAIGVVIGSVLLLAIQVPPLFRGGFRYVPRVDLRDAAARQTLLLMGPRAVGLGVGQLSLVISTALASLLVTGSITAYNIAFTVLQIPIGIIGVPLGIVALPAMATELARGSVKRYTDLLVKSLRLILFVMLPMTAFGIVLRRQVITLLFDYGQFDAQAVDLTSDALFFFLLGLASESLLVILARAFYAGRDTRTPVIAAIIAVVVNVTIAIVTIGPLGLPGLALGLAVGSWIETVILVAILRLRVAGFSVSELIDAGIRSGIAALVGGIVTFFVARGVETALGPTLSKPELAIQVVLAGGLGTLAVVGVAVVLRIPELPSILGLMRDALRRSGS
ncbi:MAG: murein biosynthesis integral membrane protein MurJ [Chloroflexota bacterium]